MVRLALADDHQLVLDGLKSLIHEVPDFELVSDVTNGRDLCLVADNFKLDVVLVDIDMPIMNGMQATEIIKKKHPEVKVLVLTMHNEKGIIQKVLEVGADGYLLKNTNQHELIEAIRKVVRGEKYFSPEVTMSLASMTDGSKIKLQNFEIDTSLTEREIEILKMIAQGYSNKEIGDKLFISHRTVDTHRTNLMRKLDAKNIAALIRYAIRAGLVD
ncbi:MAG: response regulator transcription factor [Bacteroidetes bacterium]|jgi:DNA-binding NarL/FixJ family response regulator|nr:response regulator transcription factor [Bacteroidota bacterium]